MKAHAADASFLDDAPATPQDAEDQQLMQDLRSDPSYLVYLVGVDPGPFSGPLSHQQLDELEELADLEAAAQTGGESNV